MNETRPALDIESLLGQATPRPWKIVPDNDSIYRVGTIVDAKGDCIAILDSRGALASKEEIVANAKLIVLAVNALPAFLKLREVATTALSVGEIKFKTCVLSSQVNDQITNALSEVDAALGLSTEPSSTPVDTKEKDL